MLLTETSGGLTADANDHLPSNLLGFLDGLGDDDARPFEEPSLDSSAWAVGEGWRPRDEPTPPPVDRLPATDDADGLGARLADELTFDAPALFSATAGEFTPDGGLAFDAPASFSATAGEFRPSRDFGSGDFGASASAEFRPAAELRSSSTEFRPSSTEFRPSGSGEFRPDAGEFRPSASEFRPASAPPPAPRRPAPSHDLAAFFLAAHEESRSLAVIDCALTTARLVEAASDFGDVSGVDDSFGGCGVVFLQFDDVRCCSAARSGLTERVGGFPASCEGVVFGPAPRGVRIRGSSPGRYSLQDASGWGRGGAPRRAADRPRARRRSTVERKSSSNSAGPRSSRGARRGYSEGSDGRSTAADDREETG